MASAFLDHLETVRHNSMHTRNNRLAAINSVFSYTALRHPEHAVTILRVLAIAPKRFDSTIVTYRVDEETDTLLGACNQKIWTEHRTPLLPETVSNLHRWE